VLIQKILMKQAQINQFYDEIFSDATASSE
jgi:hypothetical protein